MIDYWKGLYGATLLFRVHGSVVYKAMVPGLFSGLIYLVLEFFYHGQDIDHFLHPYAVGMLIASLSFLIVFRANQGYGRYWEACGHVHHMMSKWLDATTHAGVYHLQQSHFDPIKPPSYFDHHELNYLGLSRDRERGRHSLVTPVDDFVDNETPNAIRGTDSASEETQRWDPVACSINRIGTSRAASANYANRFEPSQRAPSLSENHPQLIGEPRLDGNWGAALEGKPVPKNGHTPSLYLQELCHLSSLAVAVAFSTLRNDIEGTESPLDVWVPGSKWPEVDPDHLPKEAKREFYPRFLPWKILRYMLGMDRMKNARAMHNASRPMLVLGGVSEAEIALLQKARGASAKTQLAWGWLSEFMIREHLAGSMGKVGPPIVSRCFQFMSDGMIYYNHARKVMFIPFPFPSAQLSVFFMLIIVWAIPVVLVQYVNQLILGFLVAFSTVTCLVGLHEVGRELENPYRNIPNEVPLGTLLAQYNEALVTMYLGYHPDHFWDPAMYASRLSASANDNQFVQGGCEAGKAVAASATMDTMSASSNGGSSHGSPEKKTGPVGKTAKSGTTVRTTKSKASTLITSEQQSVETSYQKSPTDLGQLEAVVAQQAKEIKQLRQLIARTMPKGDSAAEMEL